MTLMSDAKFKEKLTLGSKNDMKKVAHQISTFWTFHCLPEVVRIPHVIFETRSQLLYKLCTIL